MSPHHLQRVAIRGSRTSAPARPAAGGPPRKPELVWCSGVLIPVAQPTPPPFDIERRHHRVLASDLERPLDVERGRDAEHAANVEPVPKGEFIVTRGSTRLGVDDRTLPPRPVVPQETYPPVPRLLPSAVQISSSATSESVTSDDLAAAIPRVRSRHALPERVEAPAPESQPATPPTAIAITQPPGHATRIHSEFPMAVYHAVQSRGEHEEPELHHDGRRHGLKLLAAHRHRRLPRRCGG